MDVSPGRHELIRWRERLENGRLAKCQRAVLFGMAETATAEPVCLRRNRGRGLFPLHAAVNAIVRLARLFPVALGAKLWVPVVPGPSGTGGLDAAQVLLV